MERESYTANMQEKKASAEHFSPCKEVKKIPRSDLNTFLSRLFKERLERKEKDLLERVEACNGSWEEAFFQTLARSFGFGSNADAFETWAKRISLVEIGRHRDDLFQIEAYFFGQAGLLEMNTIKKERRSKVLDDDYFQRLLGEYRYLAHKFSLKPIDDQLWRFENVRPQTLPYIRLSQLARLHFSRKAGMSQILASSSIKELKDALSTAVSPYWQTHYSFGTEHKKRVKKLSDASVDGLIINAVVPLFYAYGRHRRDSAMQKKALSFIKDIAPEHNRILREWQEKGLKALSAHDSQALLQLRQEHCDRGDCELCIIGKYQ